MRSDFLRSFSEVGKSSSDEGAGRMDAGSGVFGGPAGAADAGFWKGWRGRALAKGFVWKELVTMVCGDFRVSKPPHLFLNDERFFDLLDIANFTVFKKCEAFLLFYDRSFLRIIVCCILSIKSQSTLSTSYLHSREF